jgi:hypothetical protein
MKSFQKLTYTFATLLLLSLTPTLLKAEDTPKPPVTAIQAEQAHIMQLRLDEINAMDKSGLTAAEKKALRKEVKAIKKVADGGVYISLGAIIIILLLLIILL